MIELKGSIIVPEQDLVKVTAALPQHIELTQAEAGCVTFQVEQDQLNPKQCHVYELFQDQAAFDSHQARVQASEWGAVTQGVSRHYEVSEFSAPSQTPDKACPVVLREGINGTEILGFCHPEAGRQLVKGTIEPGEDLATACTRELFEESGLKLVCQQYLGCTTIGDGKQTWGFYEMTSGVGCPDSWRHFTEDGGGLVFEFFWRPLSQPLTGDWHSVFREAISFIATRLEECGKH